MPFIITTIQTRPSIDVPWYIFDKNFPGLEHLGFIFTAWENFSVVGHRILKMSNFNKRLIQAQ